MELRLLGPVEAFVGGQPLHLAKQQHRLILGILGLSADRPVTTDRLIDLLWPEQPPARARAVLHSRVSELRAALRASGVDALSGGRSGYRLRVDPNLVDAHRFRVLLDEARRARSDVEVRDLILLALALWRGPVLGGRLPERSHESLCRALESARFTAIEDLFESELRLGNHGAIVDELVELSVADPGRERLTGALMLALHRSGRTAEAVEVYQRTSHWLRTELGLDPGRKLQQLHVALLRDDPELSATAPARVAPGWLPPRQLPPAVRHFTGRARELAELDRLANQFGPMVTAVIYGPSGIGKSALAVQWAHSAADRFTDGQLYLDLRGSGDGGGPMSSGEAVRSLLDGLGDALDRGATGVDAQVGRFRSLLAGRRVLVVLDNILDADQVRPLLPGAPGCMALVTSSSELSSLVSRHGAAPLALAALSAGESRSLLVKRLGAGRLAAEPSATDEIVARCAGVPLALAIVAAQAVSRPEPPLSALAAWLREVPLKALLAGEFPDREP